MDGILQAEDESKDFFESDALNLREKMTMDVADKAVEILIKEGWLEKNNKK